MLLAFLAILLLPAHAGVVINEVMYHPPDDRDELQWVELLNPAPTPADVGGWSFTKGFKFTLPEKTVIPPAGFLVISRDRGAFVIHYGTNFPVLGNFTGRLSHSGEGLELADRNGRVADAVRFADTAPWPTSPDGMSPSLERVRVQDPGDDPANWAPSPMPATRGAAGTPGRPNAAARTNRPPRVENLQFTPPPPGKPADVAVEVVDPDGVKTVEMHYRVLTTGPRPGPDPGSPPSEQAIPMARTSGDTHRGGWSALLPAQSAGSLVRFRIAAGDEAGSAGFTPHPDDALPTWTYFVGSNTNTARVPLAFLVPSGPEEQRGSSLRTLYGPGPRGPRGARPPLEPARGDSTLVYFPTNGGPVRTLDHIRFTPRQGGWKVRLQKDQLLDGMSTINLIFEYQPRFVLAEHLAYALYRAAGVPTPLSGHWRVAYAGRPLGYHLFVEQPNSTFLRRVGRDPDGDLYKLLWYGRDLVGQHEKKNNPETGHTALVELVEALQESNGNEQWRLIERQFNVEEAASYYAVNMCLQNWDGFFNNYFVYRSPGPAGRWEILPWDEDKTWGDYDGASPGYDWYTMPLTMGMAGDQPKMSLLRRFLPGGGGGGPMGGPQWWRPPGWFSGPLLANPTFRQRFRTRLKELCETEFTSPKMELPIAAMEQQLEPEVRYRAQLIGSGRNREIRVEFGGPTPDSEIPLADEAAAVDQFKRHIDSFRRQVRFRREFILKELAAGG